MRDDKKKAWKNFTPIFQKKEHRVLFESVRHKTSHSLKFFLFPPLISARHNFNKHPFTIHFILLINFLKNHKNNSPTTKYFLFFFGTFKFLKGIFIAFGKIRSKEREKRRKSKTEWCKIEVDEAQHNSQNFYEWIFVFFLLFSCSTRSNSDIYEYMVCVCEKEITAHKGVKESEKFT